MMFTFYSSATDIYYGSGNYVSSAPNIPTTGLKFYVTHSAVSTYGSLSFTGTGSIFQWNGDYNAHVAQVVVYPASKPTGAFSILAEPLTNYAGEAYFYTQSGAPLDRYTALDSNSIYTCNIGINNNFSFFSNDQSYLEKTIKHEVGHAFILKHPSSVSIPSVMQQGRPGSSGAASYEVTDGDRANMEAKWG